MTRMIVDELGRIPMSPFLKATLARSAEYATAQSHREVTLEHMLLALAEDPEASVVLKLSNVDITRLMSDVSGYLGGLEDRVAGPGVAVAGAISGDLERILKAAAAAAQQGRRREINGAIVLAAIVGDGKTPSAHMLRAQGLTFEEAIRALQRMSSLPPPQEQAPSLPAPSAPAAGDMIGGPPAGGNAGTGDAMAAARERVAMRTGHVPDQVTAPPSETASAPPYQPVPAPVAAPEPAPSAPAPSYQPSAAPVAEMAAPVPVQPAPLQPSPSNSLDDAVASIRRERVAEQQQQPAQPSISPDWQPVRAPQPAPAAPPAGYMPPPAPMRTGPPQGYAPQPPQQHPAHPNSWTPSGGPTPPPSVAPHPGVGGARAPLPVGSSGPALPGGPPQGQWPQGMDGRNNPSPYPAQDEDLARLDARRPAAPPAQRQPGPPQQGVQPGRPGPAGAPAQRHPASNRPAIEPGQLHETLPRKMRVGVPVVCEVLISRADVKNAADRLQNGGAAYRHEISITRAMTVRLRAPDGGFTIETTSPETQWIENILNLADGDSARWRWIVTARERGKRRLQLVVSARTVDPEGLSAETALPDKVIDVRVSINYAETAKLWGGWIAAAILGGLLARFGEGTFDIIRALINRSGGG